MGETIFDQKPSVPTSQPAPASPTPAGPSPVASGTPAMEPTQGTVFDTPEARGPVGTVFDTAPKPAPTAPDSSVGEIRAREPSLLERFTSMFTEPMRSQRGDAYYRDHPDKRHEGFIAPEEFLTESEKHDHPMVTAIGEEIGGLTSPESVLMLLATEGLGAATPFLRGGLKVVPRLVSAGFAGQMIHGAYKQYPAFKAALDAGDESEAERILTHIILAGAMATQASQHAIKGAPVRAAKTEGAKAEAAPSVEGSTIFGERTTVRPTTIKTAGVEAPIAATQQPNPSLAATVAQRFTSPGAAREFQKTKTVPAAQRQIVSALGQVMEDAIGAHESIAEGKPMPDAVAGTQKASKFQTIDEAAQAGERAAKSTWRKGDAVDTREMEEWQQKADEIQRQVDEHNKLVDEHNANLGEGEDLMAPMDVKELLPEKPKTLADVRSDWSRAKANSRSSDPAVRQDAFDNQIPAAEKALDKWFKQHPDDISQEEYQSVKRLTFQHERMQDISNKLRGPMDTGTLTGNKLRNIEASFNNRGAKYGRPNAFRDLLGDAGYQNWRNIAKVLDPLKGPGQIERGIEVFSTALLGHLMPVGVAAKLGTEFLLNRALFDPNWGKWFTKNYAGFKLDGKVPETAAGELDDLMKDARLTDSEAKQLGWSQEQIDKGEHLPKKNLSPELSSQLAKNAQPVPDATKYGGSNKGVSTDQYKAAVASFNQKLMGGLKTGVPFPLGDMMTIGRYHMEAGARAFGEWSSKMITELGEAIRPHLQKVWDALSASDEAHAQFKAHEQNGGSTFSAKGKDLGGSDAYAVGAYPERTQQHPDADFNAGSIDAFKKANADLLSKEGHAVGTWKDPDTGMHTLDVTRLIPDKAKAIAAGRAANQKAIYHLGRGETVDTGGTGEAIPPQMIQVHHYSNEPGLTEVNPEFMGKGVRGAERARMNEPGFLKRSNFGTDRYREPAVQSAKNHYVADVDANRFYDVENDPDGIWAEGWKKGGATAAEKAVHDAGYDGYRVRDEVASFKPTKVRLFEGSKTVFNNASGESAASQEAINRQASEKAQGIKRVKVLKNGQEVPLIGADAVDARAGKGETIVKRYADGHEEIQDQGQGANYTGLKVKAAAAGAGSSAVSLKDGRVVDVSVQPDTARNFNEDGFKITSSYRGAVVGESTLAKVKTGRNAGKWYPVGTEVSPEWRRLGVATSMYDAAEKSGIQLHPGALTTPEIKAFWKDRLSPDATASEIPTRYPRGKSRSSQLNPTQHVNLEAMQMADEAAPSGTTADGRPKRGYMEKMARTLAAYPSGVKYSKAELKNPQAVVSKFINHLSENLEWLYNQVPEETRRATKQWYDSANKVNGGFAKQFGVTPEQSAGVTAALSPQNPWDNNVGLAKAVMDTWANRQNVRMTPEMEKKAIDILSINPDFRGLMKQIRGKSLSEIKLPDKDTNPDAAKAEAVLKGLWIRLFDEAHGSRVNDTYRPDGTVMGPSPDTRSWIGLDHVAKAVRILEDGSLENINSLMGDGHKIRNFYNNIINPNSPNGHVTIDTHAVAAAQMQPLGPDSTEAAHNFGGGTKGIPGPPQSAPVGLKGTYPVYAEAYRRTAATLGVRPRELQSIAWEAIKSLMGDDKKTPELKAKVRDIWSQVQKGKLTPDEARERIKEESGGFSKPSWMSEEEWERHGSEVGDTEFAF